MKEFITKYKPYALEIQCKTGISHLFILAQSALETGWGKNMPEWGKKQEHYLKAILKVGEEPINNIQPSWIVKFIRFVGF